MLTWVNNFLWTFLDILSKCAHMKNQNKIFIYEFCGVLLLIENSTKSISTLFIFDTYIKKLGTVRYWYLLYTNFKFTKILFWYLLAIYEKMSFSDKLDVQDDPICFKTPKVFPTRRSSIFMIDMDGNFWFYFVFLMIQLMMSQLIVIFLDLTTDTNPKPVPKNMDAYNDQLKDEISEWKILLKEKNTSIKRW